MNAYFFTAALQLWQKNPPRVTDTGASAIALGDDLAAAQERFEKSLIPTPRGENSVQIEIKKMVALPFVDQLFTESGNTPLDWPRMVEEALSTLQAIDPEAFAQANWIDANQMVRPGSLSPDLESLKRTLPPDVSADLNWAAEKQLYFIVSVLSPSRLSESLLYESEAGSKTTDSQEENTPSADDFASTEDSLDFPGLARKEAIAMVRARNSAAAAWLWRRYTADTPLASHEITVEPWDGAVADMGD